MVTDGHSQYNTAMKSKTFLPYDLDQPFLLPPSLREWLPAKHLVYMVVDLVGLLDLSPVLKCYSGAKGGRPAYDPRMMVALLLYGYATNVRSSRKLEQATYEQVPFRVLTADQHPDHDTIAAFRVRHREFLEDLFLQSVKLCARAGMVGLGHVSVDGSKVKANASRHKAMSYSRMQEEEKRLKEKISKIFAEAEEIDRREDEEFGKGNSGFGLPEELDSSKKRLKKIKEAMAAIEQDAEEKAENRRREREENDRKLRKEGKTPRKKKEITNDPEPRAQRNFTDPDARMMKSGSTKSFEYSYNAQIAVDSEHQVIVATDVSQEANDVNELKPLMEQTSENLDGEKAEKVSGDTGYFSESNVEYLEESGIDGYLATKREKHSEQPAPAPRGRIPKGLTKKGRMARKLRTKPGKKVYSRRKAIVEPVFGQIKECLGFRSFLLRGHEKVRGEWHLIAAVHNFLKLLRSERGIEGAEAPG